MEMNLEKTIVEVEDGHIKITFYTNLEELDSVWVTLDKEDAFWLSKALKKHAKRL